MALLAINRASCVISSFITKPQQRKITHGQRSVALYPLSSPNHNQPRANQYRWGLRYILFHHQTTTHHHTFQDNATLRYILFHHQTTTPFLLLLHLICCVISSFITKPQHTGEFAHGHIVALYPLSSPNHNAGCVGICSSALRYILFHHQTTTRVIGLRLLPQLRYILFHHQTTTSLWSVCSYSCCVISSFITKPQLNLL